MKPSIPSSASVEPNDGNGPAFVGFDFDGTLAAHRGGWSLLYRLFGVEAAGEARTTAFWDGELTYEEWITGNIEDWRRQGVRKEDVERAATAVKLRAGAADLLRELQYNDIPFGIISAGVRDLIKSIERFSPAFIISNEVIYDDTVPVDVMPRVPPNTKGDILQRICDDANIDPTNVVYVGDSAQEAGAYETAGTAIQVNPTDPEASVDRRFVDHVVTDGTLEPIRHLVIKE